MRVAIISVGELAITAEQLILHLPPNTTEMILGGEGETEIRARAYARENHIELTELFLEVEFGRYASVIRHIKMMDACDCLLLFWDGKSLQANFLAERCKGKRVPYKMIKL
ncbi:MAG: hypothetical protein FWE69_00665 [Clostridiales bacterium]|nr:hypothetical protein [Clostridiales bacterium]